jgi:hypothetical protein
MLTVQQVLDRFQMLRALRAEEDQTASGNLRSKIRNDSVESNRDDRGELNRDMSLREQNECRETIDPLLHAILLESLTDKEWEDYAKYLEE